MPSLRSAFPPVDGFCAGGPRRTPCPPGTAIASFISSLLSQTAGDAHPHSGQPAASQFSQSRQNSRTNGNPMRDPTAAALPEPEQLKCGSIEKGFIPVRFDDCEIPDFDLGAGRMLAGVQRADLFGDSNQENASRLVTAIKRILGMTWPTRRR
jgi:hypothetical protein